MVRRRRTARGRVLVDLGELGRPGTGRARWRDPDPSTAPSTADDDDDEAARARRARVRAHRIRAAVAVGTVAFVGLAAWGATTEIAGHDRAQRLASAPGGVLSLARAPHVTWSADTESADATADLPGLVVVRRGTVLHALDAGTGTERWHVDVGGDPHCGAFGSVPGAAVVADPLVCWSGSAGAGSRVTVVHADGSSSTRPLDAAISGAAGTPDGGLVTVRLVGATPTADEVSVTPSGGLGGTLATGQDAVVSLEDATTGVRRWQHTVAYRPVTDPASCGSVTADRTGPTPTYTFAVSPPSVLAYDGLVELHGCGLQAAFAPDGTVVADPEASAWWYAEPYVDGGVLEQVGGYRGDTEVASVLHGPHGAATYPRQVLNPWATDGRSSGLVLAGSAGVPLTAYGPDGAVRWQATHVYSTLLVRTATVAVLTRTDGGIAGVDLRTGRELWVDADLLAGASGTVPPRAAFTDGRRAALVVDIDATNAHAASGESTVATTDIVGLDLATGAVRWRTTLPEGGSFVAAVEGHLVDTARTGFTFIDTEGPGGAAVNHSPGTVHALG